jgi:arginyl-tRNA synthetase
VLADLDKLLNQALHTLAERPALAGLASLDVQLERTRDSRHGDFTTNIAMQAAKLLGQKPRNLAAEIVAALPSSPLVAKTEVAGPGFINFTLTPEAHARELRAILEMGDAYGRASTGAGRRVLIEYLSANPTGPLHVGHGRHAAYGASLANVLRAAGFAVDEEYYVNDAGRQMDILAASVWLRYAELCGIGISFPANAYQGAYIRDIATEVHARDEDAWLGDAASVAGVAADTEGDPNGERRLDRVITAIKEHAGAESFAVMFKAALGSVLGDIENDLADFGVRPQRWYSERSLTETGAVERALDTLAERGMLYEQDGAKWFRSTAFGDDKDRVVVRENGAKTYFASDIAYHLEKCERGYDLLLNVLGADHHGYVARVRAGLEALGKAPDILEVRLVQFVVLFRGQVKAQMSTRTGEYVTLRELRNEVGNDAARFFYVSRSNDQHLEFDLELAKSQSNDNPVYYIQYAHARVGSLLRRLEQAGYAPTEPGAVALHPLTEPEEQALTVVLTRYPEIVALAALHRAPQHVVHFLREVAAAFHANYNAHRVLVEDRELRDARVALALAAGQVIRNGLALLGVSAPLSM